MSVYYYNYLTDHLKPEQVENLARLESLPNGETLVYEALNLVDGKRTTQDIANILAAAYGLVPVDAVVDYFRLLEKAQVVTLQSQ